MNVDLTIFLLMGLATYFTRAIGLLIAERLPKSGRARVALDALPPAVLTAVIAPALAAGPAEMIAGAITIALSFRLPLLATVVVGVVSVVLLRAMLGLTG